MHASGLKAFDIVPAWADFGRVDRTKLPASKVLQFIPRDQAVMASIDRLEAHSGTSFVTLKSETQSDDSVAVSLELLPTAPSGEIVDYITIVHPAGIDTRVKLHANIIDVYQAKPGSLHLGPDVQGASVEIAPTAGTGMANTHVKVLEISQSICQTITAQEYADGAKMGFKCDYRPAERPTDSEGFIRVGVVEDDDQVCVLNIPVVMRAP